MKRIRTFLKGNPVMQVMAWGAGLLACLALPLLFF